MLCLASATSFAVRAISARQLPDEDGPDRRDLVAYVVDRLDAGLGDGPFESGVVASLELHASDREASQSTNSNSATEGGRITAALVERWSRDRRWRVITSNDDVVDDDHAHYVVEVQITARPVDVERAIDRWHVELRFRDTRSDGGIEQQFECWLVGAGYWHEWQRLLGDSSTSIAELEEHLAALRAGVEQLVPADALRLDQADDELWKQRIARGRDEVERQLAEWQRQVELATDYRQCRECGESLRELLKRAPDMNDASCAQLASARAAYRSKMRWLALHEWGGFVADWGPRVDRASTVELGALEGELRTFVAAVGIAHGTAELRAEYRAAERRLAARRQRLAEPRDFRSFLRWVTIPALVSALILAAILIVTRRRRVSVTGKPGAAGP